MNLTDLYEKLSNLPSNKKDMSLEAKRINDVLNNIPKTKNIELQEIIYALILHYSLLHNKKKSKASKIPYDGIIIKSNKKGDFGVRFDDFTDFPKKLQYILSNFIDVIIGEIIIDD